MNDTRPSTGMLDQALDAVMITEPDLNSPGPRIKYINRAFTQLTGYTAEELVGRSPRLLQGPLTDRAVLDVLKAKLQAGEPFIGHTINYRKDGSTFELEWAISPIRGEDGQIVEFLSIHRNVTEQQDFRRDTAAYIEELLQQQRKQFARQVELEAANARLEAMATIDGLTGAFNHRYFHEKLGRINKHTGPVSVLMVDVDHFKSFNDAFGHPAGDTVLQAVAMVLKNVARKTDIVARYGGEEFAILMSDCEADPALAIALRICSEVEAMGVPQRPVTVSIGVSTRLTGEGTGRALLEQADIALYAAKAAGRNRVMHHRHVRTGVSPIVSAPVAVAAPAGGKATQCSPSPSGCLRCESVPASPCASAATMVLGAQDADASNSLRHVLGLARFDYTVSGPLVLVSNMRNRLSEMATAFKAHLSPVTQASVMAAYVTGGAASSDQLMSALLFARPLSDFIHNLEYEWVREALSDGWLFSVFHPIIHAETGELFGLETLLRARNPHTQQVMGAGQIIGACEKLGLQHQLDQRARQAAIEGAARHAPAEGKIFINFLPNTIYDPAICLRTTMEAAARHQIDASRLVFEVVETEKIPDMNQLRKILDYYRSRGMGTAIDDMGAGYTGVDYITSLQPDFVKLDREFMMTAETTDAGRKQMELMVGAAHQQGARVICEGIETLSQMRLCNEVGVDLMQGFLFAKPACPPPAVIFPSEQRRVA